MYVLQICDREAIKSTPLRLGHGNRIRGESRAGDSGMSDIGPNVWIDCGVRAVELGFKT